jgi:hypothetical protein
MELIDLEPIGGLVGFWFFSFFPGAISDVVVGQEGRADASVVGVGRRGEQMPEEGPSEAGSAQEAGPAEEARPAKEAGPAESCGGGGSALLVGCGFCWRRQCRRLGGGKLEVSRLGLGFAMPNYYTTLGLSEEDLEYVWTNISFRT